MPLRRKQVEVGQGLPKLKRPKRVLGPPPTQYIIPGDISGGVPGSSGAGTSSASLPGPGPSRQTTSGGAAAAHSKRKKGRTSERAEQLLNEDLPSDVLNTRRPATKVRFIPKKKSSGDKSTEDFDLDHPGVKESLEICQGFSKIKLEDWYPFFDFKYNEKNVPGGSRVEAPTTEASTDLVDEGSDLDDEDEWEDTFVYVDLEDIPHAEGLFASLSPPGGDDEVTEEASGGASLSHIEMKIFNMDSQLPVLLLGGKYLAGQWQDTIGTSLFFKKKSEQSSPSPTPHSSSDLPTTIPETNLNNIVPEPEIPFDPLFGNNYASKGDEGYELVAKSFKVLKAKHVPVVNEDQKREDFIRDNDDEFDHRDFQIPPVNLIRQFTTVKNLDYDKYIEKDIERRREIHSKWGSKGSGDSESQPLLATVKTEPVDRSHSEEDGYMMADDNSLEPTPGPSQDRTHT